MQSVPASLSLTDTAFFFDFDGTLVELAPTPDSIHVPPSLLTLLDELQRRSHGAVAIVSGRGIDNIDTFLKMPGMPIAGLHGAERHDANGDTQRIGFNDERLLRIERELAAVVDRHPGMPAQDHRDAADHHVDDARVVEGGQEIQDPAHVITLSAA